MNMKKTKNRIIEFRGLKIQNGLVSDLPEQESGAAGAVFVDIHDLLQFVQHALAFVVTQVVDFLRSTTGFEVVNDFVHASAAEFTHMLQRIHDSSGQDGAHAPPRWGFSR